MKGRLGCLSSTIGIGFSSLGFFTDISVSVSVSVFWYRSFTNIFLRVIFIFLDTINWKIVVNDRYQKTDTDTDISVKKPILEKPIPILNRYLRNFYYHRF